MTDGHEGPWPTKDEMDRADGMGPVPSGDFHYTVAPYQRANVYGSMDGHSWVNVGPQIHLAGGLCWKRSRAGAIAVVGELSLFAGGLCWKRSRAGAIAVVGELSLFAGLTGLWDIFLVDDEGGSTRLFSGKASTESGAMFAAMDRARSFSISLLDSLLERSR
ncbi:MAG: hypothetical protein GY871_04145 [Actinomycetales bacterium]|nr:hypothetical protein [Actinomycetales bacterium]